MGHIFSTGNRDCYYTINKYAHPPPWYSIAINSSQSLLLPGVLTCIPITKNDSRTHCSKQQYNKLTQQQAAIRNCLNKSAIRNWLKTAYGAMMNRLNSMQQ